jgi:hypothetical protein
MSMIIKLYPRRYRTAAQFVAPDPRNGNRATPFTLEAYKMVLQSALLGPAPNPRRGRDRFAVRSEIDGVERFLPDSLNKLWEAGRIQANAIPRLLAAIQPSLRAADYRWVPGLRIHVAYGLFFGLFLLACLLGAAAGPLLGTRARPEHAPLQLPASEWLARPQVEGQFVQVGLDRAIVVQGSVDVEFVPSVPEGLMPFLSYPEGHYSVAWVNAAEGSRLLLFPRQMSPGVTHSSSTAVTGVTLAPASIGLPPAALDDVRRLSPQVDASLITCESWQWMDFRETPWPAGMFLGLAVMLAVFGIIVQVRLRLFQALRGRRQMKWLLEQP